MNDPVQWPYALALLALMTLIWVTHRAAWRAGYRHGRYEAEIDGWETRIERNRAAAPRHAASSPRTGTGTGLAPVIVPRGATTVPWRPEPAAGPDLATSQLPRLTTTGEMAAVTDRYIYQMAQQEEDFRRNLRTAGVQ